MNAYRQNRLFHPESGRCLAIAVDHGMPGEPDLLEGIEDMEAVVDTLVAADPAAGAAGLVYGRNVIQHDDPSAMTRALVAQVHEHASALDALALLA